MLATAPSLIVSDVKSSDLLTRAARSFRVRLTSEAIDVRVDRLPWQETVVSEAKRFNVVNIGRRAGKTYLGQSLVADLASDGRPIGWWSPIYKDMLEVWREIRSTLRPVTARVSVQDRRIELVNGGVMEFWSADNPDAGRGRKYARVIIDESAKIPHLLDMFHLVIRPTLADYGGDCWWLSTPRGLNDFYTLYGYGLDPDKPEWASWQMPSHVNTSIPGLAAELEAMRASMPDLVYQQEILAQFVDLTGMVFRGVLDCAIIPDVLDVAEPGRRYVAGVDLAISGDYTVISVLDVTEAPFRQVYLDRYNNLPWGVMLDRLAEVIVRFNPDIVEVDKTGIGDMPFAELSAMLPNPAALWGVTYNSGNKMSQVQALALAFEQRRIEVLDDSTPLGRVQRGELMAYEATRKPSGVWSYSAPSGQHDDCVVSLMLAYDGATTEPWSIAEY